MIKKFFLLCMAFGIAYCDCFWSNKIIHNDSRKKNIILYYVCLGNVLYVASLNNDYLSATTIQGLTPILNKKGFITNCKCPQNNNEPKSDEALDDDIF